MVTNSNVTVLMITLLSTGLTYSFNLGMQSGSVIVVPLVALQHHVCRWKGRHQGELHDKKRKKMLKLASMTS